MCRLDERIHKHHIIPRYMGGTDESENLVEVTITQHAMFHFCNYQLWGNEEDRIAWKMLSGQINVDEAKQKAKILGCIRGGQIQKENGTGIFALTFEQRSENSKKTAQSNKEKGIAIFGMTYEEKIEARKKGGKNTSSQKWQCTITGCVSNAGGLSIYQKARGIDTFNRIRII